MTDALALADICEDESRSNPDDYRWQAAAELRRLHAENESLKKAQSLLQQHHATAWNRGHEMGMMANRKIANEAMKAVAQDAWGNTQLTEALMAAEAEAEALRKDAERYRWLRDPKNHEQLGVGQWIGDDRFNWLTATEADAAIDAAMKEADK